MRHGSRRATPTVAQCAQRAVEVCDPDGHDPLLADFLRRYEDRDEPVTALGPRSEREFFQAALGIENAAAIPAPALTTAAAVATYLAFRRDAVDEDPLDLLRLAARAELGEHVAPEVGAWLAARGVAL